VEHPKNDGVIIAAPLWVKDSINAGWDVDVIGGIDK